MKTLHKNNSVSPLSIMPMTDAACIHYSDRARFEAAATGLTALTFEDCDPTGNNGDFTEYPGGLVIQGVRFLASLRPDFPTVLFVHTPDIGGFGDCGGEPSGGHSVLYACGVETLNIGLPPGTTAFSADFLSLPSDAFTVAVNGRMFTIMPSSLPFVGFTSRAPITSLTFSGSDSGPLLSGISYGQANPASWLSAPWL